jgi:hypothetical protein
VLHLRERVSHDAILLLLLLLLRLLLLLSLLTIKQKAKEKGKIISYNGWFQLQEGQ